MPTMTYKGIEGTCEVSVEDGVLHGKLILKGDVVTYEAKTPAGLHRQFRAAVDDYLAHCAERNREPDRPFKGLFNIRISPEEHENATKCAKAQRKSLNAFVRSAIRLHCDRHEAEEVRAHADAILSVYSRTNAAPATRTPVAVGKRGPEVALG